MTKKNYDKNTTKSCVRRALLSLTLADAFRFK